MESSFLKVRLSYFYSREDFVSSNVEVFLKISIVSAALLLFNRILDKNTLNFSVYLGDSLDIESAFSVKNFFNLLGNSNFFYSFEHFNSLALDFNYLYLFNVSLTELVALPSFCLLIGTNLRFESPLINFRLARSYYENNLEIYKIGSSFGSSSYKLKHISSNLIDFLKIAEFKHTFCKNLYYPVFTYQPYLLFGQSVSSRADFCLFIKATEIFLTNIRLFLLSDVFSFLTSRYKTFVNFGVISLYSSRLHYSDLGLVSSNLKFLTPNKFDFLGKLDQASSKIILYSVGFDFYNINFTRFCKTKNFLP